MDNKAVQEAIPWKDLEHVPIDSVQGEDTFRGVERLDILCMLECDFCEKEWHIGSLLLGNNYAKEATDLGWRSIECRGQSWAVVCPRCAISDPLSKNIVKPEATP